MSLPGGEGEEARVDGLHAESANNSQCDAEECDPLAGGGNLACLIFKTVADSFSHIFVLVTGECLRGLASNSYQATPVSTELLHWLWPNRNLYWSDRIGQPLCRTRY